MDRDTIDAPTLELIERRLGRAPRGLQAVAVRDSKGEPMVIRVASIVDGKPFPTLFWLIDPELCLRIDRVEAAGVIALLQEEIDADPALQAQMREDHEAHIALRGSYLTPAQREAADRQGFLPALETRGIGGIADFSRIRCLHTWYAAHLVVANTIGRMLDEYWAAAGSSEALHSETVGTGSR